MIRLQGEIEQEIGGNETVERLLKLKGIINEMIDNLVVIISKEFKNIYKEKMKCLDYDIIERIISNDELKLKNEDSLFEFISDLYSKYQKYSSLFEYVLFNNISYKYLEEFINVFDIDYLNQGIWKSICQRLVSKSDKSSSISTRYNQKYGILTIEGIMQHLTNETGSNIHDNKTIEITSNSIRNVSYHPKNLVNYQKDDFYHSANFENGFICFDFKEKMVKVNSYTIKPNWNSDGAFNLKSWVVEASNGNNKWKEIYRRENDSILKGPKITFTFKVKERKEDFYRFIID